MMFIFRLCDSNARKALRNGGYEKSHLKAKGPLLKSTTYAASNFRRWSGLSGIDPSQALNAANSRQSIGLSVRGAARC